MDSSLVRRRHLVAELFLTSGGEAKHLLPDFARFHAKINFCSRRMPANPANHLAVHLDTLWIKIPQLAVRAEQLLACQQCRLRKSRAPHAFESGGVAQHAQAQPCDPPPIYRRKSLLEHFLIIRLP